MSQATFRFPRVHPQEQVRVTSDSPGSTVVARLRADLIGQLQNLVGPDGVTTLYLQSEAGTTAVTGTVPGDGSSNAQAAVDTAIAALVTGAPTALDTLDELAAALGDDANYAATITAALGARLITVSHGSTAGTARPTSALPVLWIGTVDPTNAVARDIVFREDTPAFKRYTGSAWTQAGGTLVAYTDRGTWLTGTAYAQGDIFTQAGVRYIVNTAHTSGTFATDVAAGKMVLLDSTIGTNLGYIDVTIAPYNVKADVRKVTDGVTTASSTTVTSATAAFTSADVGKTIVIYNPASSYVLVQQSTISSVTNSTTAVISAAVSTSRTAQKFVIGTDDTAGWQAAIDAAAAAGGGVVYAPARESLIAGPQVSGTSGGTAYSGQLLMPARNALAGQATIRFLGVNSVPLALWQLYTMPVETGLSTWLSTATSGAIFDCIPSTGGSAGLIDGHFTNINVIFEKMLVRAPNNPLCDGIRMDKAVACDFIDSAVTVDSSASTMVFPTGNTIGLYTSEINNGAHVYVCRSQIYGFGVGFKHSEHLTADQLHITYCKIACQVMPGYHVSRYLSMTIQECPTGIYNSPFNALTPTIEGSVDFEYRASTGSDTWKNVACWDDAGGAINGILRYHVVNTSSGVVNYLPGRGGNNISLQCITTGSTPSKQATTAVDTVQRVNDSASVGTMDTGQLWNPNGVWGVNSNQIYQPTAGVYNYLYVQMPNIINPTISATIKAGGQGGLLLRANGGAFFAVVLEPGLGQVRLTSNSTSSVQTSTAVVPVAGTSYAVVATVTQTNFTVTVNGVTTINYNLSAGDQTAVNAGRRYGLYAYNETSTRWSAISIV